MNNNPIFIGTPRVQSALSTTSTGRDGLSGTYTTLYTPGPDGSRIERVTAMVATPGTASTAKAVRIYIRENNILYLYREALLPASTPSGTVLGSNITFNFNGGLCLGTQSVLVGGQSTGNTTNDSLSFITEGGDF
jgi:hypothetical protein